MDIPYDQIRTETVATEPIVEDAAKAEEQPSLNTEIQQVYSLFSSSPWGARLGNIMGTVKKQSESYYGEAVKEYNTASEQASKGFADLTTTIMNRTRGMSLNQGNTDTSSNAETVQSEDSAASGATEKQEEGVLARLKTQAAARLKDIERAEEAADEALLKFGTGVVNFLREAVTIAAPGEDDTKSSLLFESKGEDGKRVIHTTRLDAQLYIIHSTLDSFMKDPASKEYAEWKSTFSADDKTEQIGKDLETYPELRAAMEKLVPDKVTYAEFWTRYYFLRHVIDYEEQRRRELVKDDGEEVAWDEDSDTEAAPAKAVKDASISRASSSTLRPSAQEPSNSLLKPTSSRKSNDQQSQPDSEASYDVISGAPSGAPSHAPGSPRVKEESDEEDWE